MERACLLVAVVALAACPPPPPVTEPPITTPTPPPVAPPVATPEPPPTPPGVIGVRGAGATQTLVWLDVATTDEPRVLHTFHGKRASPVVFDVAVDATSGRYAVLVLAEQVDGARAPAKKDVSTLVLGDAEGGAVARLSGDPSCVQHRCFELAVWIAPGGAEVVTATRRSGGTDLLGYAFADDAKPARLTSAIAGFPKKGVIGPTVADDHDEIAYAIGDDLHVVRLDGGKDARIPVRLAGGSPALVLTDDRLIWWYRDGDRPHLAWIDRGASAALDVALPTDDDRAPPMFARAGTDELITIQGDRVVAISLTDGTSRELRAGVEALHDVSADGRWALITEPEALIVVDLVERTETARRAVTRTDRLSKLRFAR